MGYKCYTPVVTYKKVDPDGAIQILRLFKNGWALDSIASVLGYKRMDVFNVVRGNSFSNITGILDKKITQEEITVVKYFLDKGYPYREVAKITGIDANRVRNIKGRVYYQNRKTMLESKR